LRFSPTFSFILSDAVSSPEYEGLAPREAEYRRIKGGALLRAGSAILEILAAILVTPAKRSR